MFGDRHGAPAHHIVDPADDAREEHTGAGDQYDVRQGPTERRLGDHGEQVQQLATRVELAYVRRVRRDLADQNAVASSTQEPLLFQHPLVSPGIVA